MISIQTTSLIYDRSAGKLAVAAQVFSERTSRKVAHHPMGGKIFRNHINFHHTHYSDAHLVSRTYLGDEGNTTPYFFIPIFLIGGCAYFLLPLNLFVVMVIASAASFYAHVFFDKEYHVEGSRLQRFAWFRRQ